jgi:hypothetical protein
VEILSLVISNVVCHIFGEPERTIHETEGICGHGGMVVVVVVVTAEKPQFPVLWNCEDKRMKTLLPQ